MALSSVSTTAAATATTAVVSPASYSSSSLHPPPPLRWTRIEASGSPPLARDGHCMTSVTCDDMREVYMFGGVTAAGGGESADLFRLDMDFGEWEKLETKGGNVPVNVPVARSGATLAAVGNDLFLCGGINSELAWLDTVHRFDSGESSLFFEIEMMREEISDEGLKGCRRSSPFLANITYVMFWFCIFFF